MDTSSTIERTDSRGRVRWSKQRRQQLLAEFDRSGLAGPKFAAITGVHYQTFMGWLARRRVQEKDSIPSMRIPKALPEIAGSHFVEAIVQEAAPQERQSRPAGLILRFPSGALVELSSNDQTQLAAALLHAWEKKGC